MASTALEYRDGAITCRGYLVHDRKHAGVRPGVVLFPDARGVGEAVKDRTRRVAALGFVALAADPYREGKLAHDMPEAMRMMGDLRRDVTAWRKRAGAALDALAMQSTVDRGRLAAIGYCFGGSTALELARSGAPLAAVVSFHGGLESPKPDDAANIKARLLVCHGADDPLVPPAQVAAFVTQMRKTKVDWQLRAYGGTVHGFTNPEADQAGVAALAYNPSADKRSWQAMLELFGEAFGTA